MAFSRGPPQRELLAAPQPATPTMASRLLVLLALLATASQAAGSCQHDFQWQCRNGLQCISAWNRCEGDRHCDDGSDEEGCDELPTVALPVNATATARVQYDRVHWAIELHLCGAEHCSSVRLLGEQADGTLRYETFTECNRLGSYCSDDKNPGLFDHFFPPGEVVLVAQRRPGQLAVWRQGRPDVVATVPVQDDYSTLRVRPEHWAIDMPVQLTVSEPPAARTDPSPPGSA